MNYRMISRVMGLILLAMAALMLLPLIAGLCFHERVVNFIITIAVTAALGGLLLLPKPIAARSSIPAWSFLSKSVEPARFPCLGGSWLASRYILM